MINIEKIDNFLMKIVYFVLFLGGMFCLLLPAVCPLLIISLDNELGYNFTIKYMGITILFVIIQTVLSVLFLKSFI